MAFEEEFGCRDPRRRRREHPDRRRRDRSTSRSTSLSRRPDRRSPSGQEAARRRCGGSSSPVSGWSRRSASGVEASWTRLILAGKSRHPAASTSTSPTCRLQDRRRGAARRRRGGAVPTPTDYVEPKDQRRIDDFIIYGIAAADEAVEDAGWKPEDEEERERTGVMIGSGIGGLDDHRRRPRSMLHEKGPRRVSPFFIPVGADQPGQRPGLDPLRLQGPEPRGRDRLLDRRARDRRRGAADQARRRRRDGGRRRRGGDLPDRHRRLRACRALSTGFNDTPEQASRPWDRDRDGFVMGEGAGVVVLEELRARQGARRQDLRRGERLRHVGRRLSHHRAGRGRRRRLPLRCRRR